MSQDRKDFTHSFDVLDERTIKQSKEKCGECSKFLSICPSKVGNKGKLSLWKNLS